MSLSSYKPTSDVKWFQSHKIFRIIEDILVILFIIGYVFLFFIKPSFIFIFFVFSLPIIGILLFAISQTIHNFNKTNKWFYYNPGIGRTLVYSPRTWQAWFITIVYFASLVVVPIFFFSFFLLLQDQESLLRFL